MARHDNSRVNRDIEGQSRRRDSSGWIIHLIDKCFDSITTAGPIAWISVVCIVALCAVVLVVYILSGLPTRLR
jgi:hypothetical protein